MTHITVAVCNPADPKFRWEGLFLVDTGAVDCMAPGKHLKEIGINPAGARLWSLSFVTERGRSIEVQRVPCW